jgi:hypothetical protein
MSSNKVNILVSSQDSKGAEFYTAGTVVDIKPKTEAIIVVEIWALWFMNKQFGVSLQVSDILLYPGKVSGEFCFNWSGKSKPTPLTSVDTSSPSDTITVNIENESDKEPAKKKQRKV